jgi:hypothetical protein
MRAFSCAALLRATREPWNYGDGLGTDSTLVQLVLSLSAVPVDFTAQAVKSLSWLLLNSDPEGRDKQVCAYGLGLLWFALRNPDSFPDELLGELAQWVDRRANEIFESAASTLRREDAVSDDVPTPAGDGLREMVVSCQNQSSWEQLAIKFIDLDLSARSSEVQMQVQTIGGQLLGML